MPDETAIRVALVEDEPLMRKGLSLLNEVRLLGLLAEGYQYKEAADKLNLRVNTVRTYVRKALRQGIID